MMRRSRCEGLAGFPRCREQHEKKRREVREHMVLQRNWIMVSRGRLGHEFREASKDQIMKDLGSRLKQGGFHLKDDNPRKGRNKQSDRVKTDHQRYKEQTELQEANERETSQEAISNIHLRVSSVIRWEWKNSRYLQEMVLIGLDRWREVKKLGVKNKSQVLALGTWEVLMLFSRISKTGWLCALGPKNLLWKQGA